MHRAPLVLAVMLTACRDREAPEPRRAPLDAYPQRTIIPRPPRDAAVLPDAIQPLVTAPARCLKPDVAGTVTVGAEAVTYCQEQRVCAIWDRKTREVRIEPQFDVEADPEAAVGAPARPKSDVDARISFPEDRVQLCPKNRACFQFLPDQSGGVDVEWVAMNAATTLASVTLFGKRGMNGRVEIWSLETARRKVSIPVEDPGPDETHEIHAEFVPGGIIVYPIDGNGYTSATLYGLDGRRRAALGEGSAFLDYDSVYMLDQRRLAVFDWGADGAPYRLLVQDVRTGAVLSRYEIPLAGKERAVLDRFDAAIIVTEQWSTELRIDLIDARPKKGVHQFFIAPGCA